MVNYVEELSYQEKLTSKQEGFINKPVVVQRADNQLQKP
jgi:hypothetical protein